MGRLLGVPVVGTLYDARVDPLGGTDLHKEEARAIRSLKWWGARVVALSGAQWDRYVQGGAFSRSFLEVIYQGVEVGEAPVSPEERQAGSDLAAKVRGLRPRWASCSDHPGFG